MSKLILLLVIFSCINLIKSYDLLHMCYKDSSAEIYMKKDAEEKVDASESFNVQYGAPCPFFYDFDADENEKWEINKNGSLTMQDDNGISLLQNTEYCFHSEYQFPGVCYEPGIVNANGTEIENDSISRVLNIIYLSALYISIPFGILSFLIYLQVPEFKKLHGKCFLNYSFWLVMLTLSQVLVKSHIFFKKYYACYCVAFFTYFSILCCFFWLNIISYDIFRRICWNQGLNNMNRNEARRLLKYSLYGYGGPLLLLGFAIIVDFTDLIPISQLKLKIGDLGCFFTGTGTVEFIFIYLPLMIIILANMIMCGITAYTIFVVQKNTAKACGKNDHKINPKKIEKFFTYFRIWLFMGVPWAMEVISWMFGMRNGYLRYIFIFFDVINCLQGVWLFSVLLFDRKVRDFLRTKFSTVKQSNRHSNGTTVLTTFQTTSPASRSEL